MNVPSFRPLLAALILVVPVLIAQRAGAETKADPADGQKSATVGGGSTGLTGGASPGTTGGLAADSKSGAAAPKGGAAADEGRPESVEIQVRRLTDKLAESFRSRAGGGRYERWAVMPLNELGEEVAKRRLGEVVSAQIENTLKNDHGFICVERLRLVEVIKELQLAQAGLFDDAKAPKVGEMAGADVLVVGSIGLLGDKYVVNARAVSASEGKVLAASQITINAANLIALSSDAVVLRTKSDAIFRSVLIPGWGQMYNRQEEKGGLLMFASGALLAGGLTFYFLGTADENEYARLDPVNNPGPCAGLASDRFGDCVGAQREIANSRFATSRALFIGLAAVYAYNVFDAWFFGYSPDASTKRLYATTPVIDIGLEGVQVRGRF